MTTFTQLQQKKHREVFFADCRQKAWEASCNADWIGKQHDELLVQYEKLKKEDTDLEESIKALDNAIDCHTKDSREKRKAQQERRNILSKQMEYIQKNAQEAQRTMAQLYQTAEYQLELAKHADTWEWKEAEPEPQTKQRQESETEATL